MIPCAFVEQQVNFFPHMTVRETLNFRVELKLGSRISKKARDELVNELIDEAEFLKQNYGDQLHPLVNGKLTHIINYN